MNRFYFGGSDSGSDDDNPLPYPKPLAREAFITTEFSPTEFLSSLHNRHQTLEDLRQELRTRSQELNKELLDLVNDNYQDFLGLGDSLKGGEEKVEEVRLGLLGFRREVDALKMKIKIRKEEMERLIQRRREFAQKERMGMNLLEIDSKLSELEEGLDIRTNGHIAEKENLDLDFSETEDESDMDETGQAVSLSRLGRRVQQYLYVKKLVNKVGSSHPFLSKQKGRFREVRQTLVLDLNSALSQSRARGSADNEDQTMKLLSLYQEIGERAEALKTIKKLSQR